MGFPLFIIFFGGKTTAKKVLFILLLDFTLKTSFSSLQKCAVKCEFSFYGLFYTFFFVSSLWNGFVFMNVLFVNYIKI